jgi:hypothetical protein
MGSAAMDRQSNDSAADVARRKGVRRTLWITGTIAVALFLFSILSMLKVG